MTSIINNTPLFELGQVVATPAAIDLLQSTGINPSILLTRHMHGDFGDLCQEDASYNKQAITDGSRIMSVYRLVEDAKLNATPKPKRADLPTVWLITDATNEQEKREYTTFLLPDDY
jgi:hypothetical protein